MSTPAEPRPLVWIADDSPIERAITERALGDAYEYETFSDGSLVLERITSGARQPDVLLLDWVMPAVTGDEVCRVLRSQPATKDLPIILVTASRVETHDVVEGLGAGANDYVPRPFVAEELRARVDNAIRAKRLREQAWRERMRLSVINKLGRSFMSVGPRHTAIAEALTACLVEGGLCDGLSVVIAPGSMPSIHVSRHRSHQNERLLEAFTAMDPCTFEFKSADEARAKLPAAYHGAIDKFGMTALAVVPFPGVGLLTGVVTAMRDGNSLPFAREDLVTIQTCLEYTAMAFENALRSDAERAVRTQLQTILEQLPVNVVVVDRQGAFTHANHVALDTLPQLRLQKTFAGLSDVVELRGPDGEPIENSRSPLMRALEGETTRGVELELRVESRPSKIVRTFAVPLRGPQGEIDSAVLVFDDITAEKEALAERERAAEFQRYVLGIVSHDLRSPLQTVMMGCDSVKLLAFDNDRLTGTIGHMQAATQRMNGIIEQLLDVVRTQLGGGIPVEPADVNLGQLVSTVLGELSLAYPTAQFEPHLANVRGNWDPGRLAQVVTNIVGNAVQHGAPTHPIRIETELSGGQAILRVRNASRARLTDEQKATLFRPFHGSRRESGGSGLGLGLYIASEILRAHQGQIVVADEPGSTTFIVRLPLKAPAIA